MGERESERAERAKWAVSARGVDEMLFRASVISPVCLKVCVSWSVVIDLDA
jgi:hypothetical protein